jgi:uncharacterized protein (DUF4415 family)
MTTKPKPLTNKAGDARELTRDDFRRGQRMRDADPEFVARWKTWQKKRGRPAGRSKSVVSVSMDNNILAALRKSGAGWQTRMNELLKAALGLNTKL